VADAEALWYDVGRWSAFVDGFGHLAGVDDAWPAGGAVVWDSRPGGRGRVLERVVSHAPGAGQELEVEDEKVRARQAVRFADAGDGRAAVEVELRYEIKERAPWTPLVDAVFVRRAMADSLRRTLRRFAVEMAADAELRRVR
jgi:uncharacterized membrane protein